MRPTNKSGASFLSAETFLNLAIPHEIHIIVKGDLFMREDIAFSNEHHPQPLANDPLLDLAVRITRVVRKSSYTPFHRCVDILAFLQFHHINVLVPLLHVFSEPFLGLLPIDDFACVFAHEGSLCDTAFRP